MARSSTCHPSSRSPRSLPRADPSRLTYQRHDPVHARRLSTPQRQPRCVHRAEGSVHRDSMGRARPVLCSGLFSARGPPALGAGAHVPQACIYVCIITIYGYLPCMCHRAPRCVACMYYYYIWYVCMYVCMYVCLRAPPGLWVCSTQGILSGQAEAISLSVRG